MRRSSLPTGTPPSRSHPRSARSRPCASGAGIGILHAFIARSLPELVPVQAAKPIRRAYWLVYHESVRPLRRIQAVAGFITRAVEAEKQLFL